MEQQQQEWNQKSLLSSGIGSFSSGSNSDETSASDKLQLNSGGSNKWFIIQYQKTHRQNACNHAIACKNDLVWTVSHGVKSEHGLAEEVFMRDGNVLRLANIIYVADSYECVCDQLQKLKVKCFELIFAAGKFDRVNNEWLLLQYNSGLNNTIYGIVNKSETVLQKDNLYDDIVAYINDGSTVYQAIIMQQSSNIQRLNESINRIRNACLNNAFLDINNNNTNEKLNLTELTQSTPTKQSLANYKELLLGKLHMQHNSSEAVFEMVQQIHTLEKAMHQESTIIATAFTAVDTAKSGLTNRLNYLNNIVNNNH